MVSMTSHMVAATSLDIIHGSGAQFVETAGSLKPQIHKGFTERPVRGNSGSAMETAYVRNCVGRCSQSRSRGRRCDTRTSDQGHSPSEIQSRRWD